MRQLFSSVAARDTSTHGRCDERQTGSYGPSLKRLWTGRMFGDRQWRRACVSTTLWEVSLMGLFGRRVSEPQPAADENCEALFPRIGGLGDDLRHLSETAAAAGALLRKLMGPGIQIEVTVKLKP